jgi:hypothetical protein
MYLYESIEASSVIMNKPNIIIKYATSNANGSRTKNFTIFQNIAYSPSLEIGTQLYQLQAQSIGAHQLTLGCSR